MKPEDIRLTLSESVNNIFRLFTNIGLWGCNPRTYAGRARKHVSAPPLPTPRGTVCH